MKKFRTVAGMGLAALTLAACGSSQGAQVLTVPTTTAPAHQLDGLYVGNYKGNDAQAIVAAKRFEDAYNTLAFELLGKTSSSAAIAATESQLRLYASAPLYTNTVALWTQDANSGDTATLVKGTVPSNGTDNTPATVTADPSNPHDLDVILCGYNDIQETGLPGNSGDAGLWSNTDRMSKVNNRWIVAGFVSSSVVTACPTN